MTSLSDVRASFLDFFRDRQHAVVPSSPLVPRNDPTLLFTNAGMVQFKNAFTGAEKRPYSRAASVQKCVRAGGKHNDLDNVGYTARHHTFFEMLGNFSFGDYFKEAAIEYAWDYIRNTLALPKERLWVTVHPTDDVARGLWKKVAGISGDRIIDHESNLWAMGPLGPCGYNSEIFYDQGDAVAGGPPGSPDEDGDRFLEFWNLVFMQFEQIDENTRIDLPKPSIDTGMGLERITAILQGVLNDYDIDLFRHIIAASVEISGAKSEGEAVFSHRVIADHLRATSFLIADGVLPSNEGRGYVLRRIMRRAMRHAHLIGAKDPLMYRLVPALVAEMGQAYPELKRAEGLIGETLKLEEVRFRDTLARGLKLLDEASGSLRKGDKLAGDVAFKLYDTYGFPLDLTQDALKAKGIEVETSGFDAAMAKQRADARKAWAGSGEAATDAQWFAVRDEFGSTEFLGYDTENAEGNILALFNNGQRVKSAKAGESVLLLTNQTPFYAESGGQVGDQGTIASSKAEGVIEDTEKKLGALHVHVVRVTKGEFKVGDTVDLSVDSEKRRATRANHSATHLLHAALKRVLGGHVSQKGSLVAPDRLRFDFSHPKPVTADELERIEQMVNTVIRQNSDTSTRVMPTDQAVAAGAEALFGEKYGDEVRVLTMGRDLTEARPYSVELCGGTHVYRLGDIGLFTILSESAVAAGVRRIEALTSEGARKYLTGQAEIAREAAAALKTSAAELPARVVQLSEDRRRLERELADAKKALALAGPAKSGGADGARQISGISAILRVVEGVSAKDLKGLADDAKSKIGSGVVAFVAVVDGRASLVVGVTDDLTSRISAVDLVRLGSEALGGKGGGGRPDMAQAGGPDGAKAADAIAAIEKRLSNIGSGGVTAAPEEDLRRRVYLVLEGGRMGGPLGSAVEFTLIALIGLNVVAYTLQSMPQFDFEYDLALRIFEFVSIAVFALEYFLRLWTAPEDPSVGERGPLLGRLYFASRPLMVIDFLAIAPALLAPFVPFIDLRVLRLVRLLRLLKIARYSPALSALANVVVEERRALYGSLLLFLCAMVLAAATMHAAEGALQPQIFGTIPSAMWWAVSTLTTVGYGDAVPHSALGRFVAGITMIIGLGLAALPVGIVATGFANSIHRRDFVVTFGMLARVPLFKGFDAQTVGEMMDMLRAQAVSAGDIVSGPGEHAAAMYFVVAGEIEVQLPGRKLRFLSGDFFGELALLHETMREATIIAVTSSRLLALSARDFESLLHKRPGLREQFAALAAEQSIGAVGPLSTEDLKEAHQVAHPQSLKP